MGLTGISGTYIVWDTFDFEASKVILGSFGALASFPKILFSKRFFFYTYDSFSTKLFTVVPFDSSHKKLLLGILKFKT